METIHYACVCLYKARSVGEAALNESRLRVRYFCITRVLGSLSVAAAVRGFRRAGQRQARERLPHEGWTASECSAARVVFDVY